MPNRPPLDMDEALNKPDETFASPVSLVPAPPGSVAFAEGVVAGTLGT